MNKQWFLVLLLLQVYCGHAQTQPHTLSRILADPAFGTHQLPLVWTGAQTITFQTGYYTRGGFGAATVPEKDFIRFDRYSNQSKMWIARQMLDDSTVSGTNRLKKVYSYVPTLPEDKELIGMHEDSTFTNSFNLNYNTLRFSAFPRQTFHFYTLASNDTIDVAELTVDTVRGSPKTNIQVVLIKRGVLTPQKP